MLDKTTSQRLQTSSADSDCVVMDPEAAPDRNQDLLRN